jgi:anti-sigma factor RsiW
MDSLQTHPDDTVILRFLDGELIEREATALRSHLDGCWQCRRSLGEWQNTIDAFLRLRESVEFAAAPPPPNPWIPFDQLVQDRQPAASTTTSLGWWRLWRLAPVAATAVIVAAVIAGVLAFRDPTPAPPAPPSAARPLAAATSSGPLPAAVETKPGVAAPAAPPPVIDTLHGQVLAQQILHSLGADLGEPVSIAPSAAQVLVRAHGLDAARWNTIQDALAHIPGAVFENLAPQSAGPGVPSPAAAPQQPRPKLFAADLLQRLGGPSAVESFANAVLDDSDAIATRAHALESLAALFPLRAPLSAPDRAIVDQITADHRVALRRHVRSLGAHLEPLLSASPSPALETATLSARAIELDRMLNAAFAGAQIPLTDPELAARIHSLLKDLEQQ